MKTAKYGFISQLPQAGGRPEAGLMVRETGTAAAASSLHVAQLRLAYPAFPAHSSIPPAP